MAQNSSLLIHEATFLDHEMNSAKTYRHTTVGEAIDMYKIQYAEEYGQIVKWQLWLTLA